MSEDKYAHRYKPGQSGNPSGKPALPPGVVALRNLTYKQFIDKLQEFGHLTKDEIIAILKSPATTGFDLMFGNWIAQAIDGKGTARQEIIERLWGRVKEVQELPESTIDVTPENLEELYKIAADASIK